nr:hypothetical protein [Tanacetum cinerariifolium]
MDGIESNDESIDAPLVSPFLDSDDGEVLNKLEEYGNARKLCRKKKAYNTIMVDGLESPDYQVDDSIKEWLIRGHENECEIFAVSGDDVRIFPDGITSPEL